ncbi:thiamine-phosphate kinase [uncultured Algimonas sp.]|uniref:thiamine-phosphate kinase n=1 Tax=uncultured Algimonas sp. TaxID=1547920 RepID=UPI002636ECBA|nr:thiamine-phosphate kinase [uncultured Algimonas sp.]
MNEADFIALLRPLAGPGGLGLMDDAALLQIPDGQDLVVSSDTMVEGVHFPMGRIGGGFSERLLRTALSDLAAKGARPVGYMLNVSWPKDRDPKWLRGFVQGLSDAQCAFDCPILGGDTTSGTGPLVASATVFGHVPAGDMVTRSGARPGHQVWHTGELGLAEIGLEFVEGRARGHDPSLLHLAEEAYLRPEPRFAFRKPLRRYASACADISDGILIDARHIATASRVALNLKGDCVAGKDFGDDYELLFTADPDFEKPVREAAKAIGLPVTLCGEVIAGEGIRVNGEPVAPQGYTHKLD